VSRATIAIGFVAVGMATWAYGGTGFQHRMRTMVNLEQDYNTHDDMGRIAIWKRGLGYVVQRPVTGLGIDNFMMAEGLTLAEQERVGKWSGAHNAFLQAFTELGVPGGLVFLALLGYAVRVGLFIRRQRDPTHVALGAALFGCTAAYAVTGVFLSHALSPVFFFLVGSTALAGFVFRYDGRVSSLAAHERARPRRLGRPALPGPASTRPF
jgi:O-antigen ligase